MPPDVAIVAPQGPFHRGKVLRFEAMVANERASFLWTKAQGACGRAPQRLTAEGSFGSTFSVTPDELGELCVRVQATDPEGAASVAQVDIQIVDRPPVVMLTQLQPMAGTKARLGSEVVVSATVTDPDPGDAPAFSLALRTPDLKDVPFGKCEDASRPPEQHCFVVTTTGPWVVAVEWPGADSTTTLASMASTLEVTADEDQPPCLVATPRADQLVHDARMPLPFETTVVDDLDAFPSTNQAVSKARFQWSVSDTTSNSFLALVDQTERVYVLPNRYLPADELRVRVDVFDRVARLPTCKATDDVCGTGTCLQRMTWTVRFR